MDEVKRHRFLYKSLRALTAPIFKIVFNYHYQIAEELEPPYIVMANHNLDIDPALVALSFPQHMYFVASEHVYRWGIVSRLIAWAFAPIARTKGSTDARTVKEILRHLRNGRNICLFAEGNRSFNGVTDAIFPATGKLVKSAGVAMATYKFEGGYFTNPRWSSTIRKGRMRGYVVRTYTPGQIKEMAAWEIQEAIERDLFEDAYARQKEEPIAFKGKRLAEGLENVLYMCPRCKGIATLRGVDNQFLCGCGLVVRYTEYGELIGELPFHTITEWDVWQSRELETRVKDALRQENPLVLSDEAQQFFKVEAGVGTTLLAVDTLLMDGNALSCGNHVIPIKEISDMAIYSSRNLVFTTTGGEHYEVRSAIARSATKYLEYFRIQQKMR